MKRTRYVYPKEQIARLWINRIQDKARTPTDNFYFSGDTIYSYGSHFPIATLFAAPNGEDVILFTLRTYSSTTAVHICLVRAVCRQSHRRVIYCENPLGAVMQFQREAQLEYIKRQFYDPAHRKLSAARKPELYTGDIRHACHMAKDFCEVMCMPPPLWALLPDGIDDKQALLCATRLHSTNADNERRI